MSDLRDLYQEVILDHNKRPRNFRELEEPDQRADGHNPLCGDTVTIYLKLDGDQIEDLSFQGSGCAISRASASMMTEALKGKTLDEAQALFDRFHDRVMGKEIDDVKRLGKLDALSGVAEFPMRVKCATLAWHTLQAAIEGRDDPVCTE
ncbi:MAG: SUF system NifU family Fe-S cluster assembly protein [Planctomycetes bacterium]|nr:SUF system NifU family Fe-S cluster assembly protein [Planctomycetota bacterium]